MPCGATSSPAPNDRTSVPAESNSSTDGSADPAHEFAPHRSATHTLRPSGATSTALVEPHVRPAGIFAHPSTVRYGFGRSFVGAGWAPNDAAAAVANTRLCTSVEEFIESSGIH